jgi:peptidoglycan hydrolase-like protein with peptidoglycan-binding domain
MRAGEGQSGGKARSQPRAEGWSCLRPKTDATPEICVALQGGQVADPESVVASLRRGAEGDGVTRLQEALRSKVFTIDVDGVFSEETENAVRRFQEANDLSANGAAGPDTLAKLV